MSTSPITDEKTDNTHPYQLGWRALNRLLHEGRSFSGNEKHCAFLNTGPNAAGKLQPFADISSAIGFDLPEDGRAIGLIDWDFDGDLDLWMTNRTAPRLRLFRNNNTSKKPFLFLRLQGNGTSTNRDAIGARVALHLKDDPNPRIKTLHAGHTFLSQSTRWLHFGLGDNDQIEKLVVHWPAGGKQEFQGLKARNYYQITQNRPATLWQTPANRKSLAASTPNPFPVDPEARILPIPGMPAPPIMVKNGTNPPKPYPRTGKGPLLVNLWSSFCLPCQEELADWTKDAAKFKAANIEVVALLTDGDNDPNLANAKSVIAEAKFPFPWMEVTDSTIQSLDAFHAASVDLWTPIPVPSSFLLDPKGDILAIYTGPVHADQIVADAKLISADPKTRRNASIPFAGRWVLDPTTASPLRVSSQMIDRNDLDSAVDYLSHFIQRLQSQQPTPDQQKSLGDAHYSLGIVLGEKLRFTDALQSLRASAQYLPLEKNVHVQRELTRFSQILNSPKALEPTLIKHLEENPGDQRVRLELALLKLRTKDHPAAVPLLNTVVQTEPQNAIARYHLANALLDSHQPTQAIEHLKHILKTNGRFLDAANRLSWVLACHPSQDIRAPREALALATRLCTHTNNQNPHYLNTLSAAQAASGQFPQAAESAKKALAIYANHPNLTNHAKLLTERLALFEAKKPYLETKWNPTP